MNDLQPLAQPSPIMGDLFGGNPLSHYDHQTYETANEDAYLPIEKRRLTARSKRKMLGDIRKETGKHFIRHHFAVSLREREGLC